MPLIRIPPAPPDSRTRGAKISLRGYLPVPLDLATRFPHKVPSIRMARQRYTMLATVPTGHRLMLMVLLTPALSMT